MGMNWKKVERVKRLVESGDYIHPAFLNSCVETDFDRFCGRLLRDMMESDERAERQAGGREILWLACLRAPRPNALPAMKVG